MHRGSSISIPVQFYESSGFEQSLRRYLDLQEDLDAGRLGPEEVAVLEEENKLDVLRNIP